MDDFAYSIPKKLARRGQVDGISQKDLLFAVIEIGLGLACVLTCNSLHLSMLVGGIGFLALALSGVILIIPTAYHENFLLVIKRHRTWSENQQRFIFKRYSGMGGRA